MAERVFNPSCQKRRILGQAKQIGPNAQRLRALDGMGARALEFAILTAACSGEACGATWAEIELDAGAWSMPASRIKASRAQRVPLSTAALTLLRAPPRFAAEPLVFPGTKGRFQTLKQQWAQFVLPQPAEPEESG